MKDALVEAALAKVNEVINKIFELKPSDYPSQDKFLNLYEEAVSEAVAKAIKTVDALRAALKVLEPEEHEMVV